MSRLKHFQRYHQWYGLSMIALFLAINAAVLATSVIMEASRHNAIPTFELWEPFVWEYSSAIAIMLLVPWVCLLIDRYPLMSTHIKRSIGLYVCAAIAFSIAHVVCMVAIRKGVYFLLGYHPYLFGALPYEFLYEFRKDAITFIIILMVVHSYRFIVSRLMGEANLVAEMEEQPSVPQSPNRLLVKKLGKEFIIKLEDVEWMESSGNYVNLHIKERIYPIRKTLGAFTDEIADKGFCRVHRSHAINIDAVESITPLPSGDGEITLKSGKVLNISRRYRDGLKKRLL